MSSQSKDSLANDSSDAGTVQGNTKPKNAAIVLIVLIIGAIVANLNLSIANVALPDIGKDLNASQVQLTMVASMFTMGLAASVLYLGAVGDRYSRKALLLTGAALSVPAALISAYAPTIEVLIGARLFGGLAAGMLFPTTLSLISALWSGPARTKAIALWSGIGGAAAALGGVFAGLLLESFWWGSVFLVTVPLAVFVFFAAFKELPWKAGETATAVDHRGGVLSVVAIATLIVGIQNLPNGFSVSIATYLGVSLVAFVLLFIHLKRTSYPLIDLKLASVPTFWVAFVSGTIGFGSLVAAMFLGQQFVQNVLGYGTLEAALVVLPCSVFLVISAQIAGKMILSRGTKMTFMIGLAFIALGFLVMILGWNKDASLFVVLLAYGVLGIGVGMTATPSSRSLMSSLPVSRAGMGSAFTDLSRDFGGAVMQAFMGSVLAVVYSSSLHNAAANAPSAEVDQLGTEAKTQILSSFESAQDVAVSYPQPVQGAIQEAATQAFSEGKSVAYVFGLVLTMFAFGLIWWKYPSKDREREVFLEIETNDPHNSEDTTVAKDVGEGLSAGS